jgi:hypothetical protein
VKRIGSAFSKILGFPDRKQPSVMKVIDVASIKIIDGRFALRRSTGGLSSVAFGFVSTSVAFFPREARTRRHQRSIQGTSRARPRQKSSTAV